MYLIDEIRFGTRKVNLVPTRLMQSSTFELRLSQLVMVPVIYDDGGP